MSKKFYVDGLTVDQILNMDPAQMAKLDKRDISRALRTVSLAANKRIANLEKYAKKTKHGYEQAPRKGKSIAVDALNWVTNDGKTPAKFGVKKAATRNQMLSQISKVRQFMNMKSSTVTGSVKLRKIRERNLFGKTREDAAKGIKGKRAKQQAYKNFQTMYNTVWSAYHKYRELKSQDPHAYHEDSMSVLSLLGQYITSGLSEDEAVSKAVQEMNKQYEEQQMEYNDLFSDDNFGIF